MLLCGAAAAQTSAIEGVVIDSVTRQPLAGVHITLHPPWVDDVPPEARYGAMSRQDGGFSIANLPASIYFVTASRAGYVHMKGAGDGVELRPGNRRTGFTVEMTPRATIAGRVTDEYGDPIENTSVEAFPAGSGARTTPLMSAMTDDRGQFRMIGAPGKYYVEAELGTRELPVTEIRSDGVESPAYASTWYPASESRDRASVVEVAAGRDLTGIDIRLVQKRSLTISGQMTGLPAHGPVDVFITAIVITPLDNGSRPGPAWQVGAGGNNGRFTLVGLAPGRYRLAGRLEGTHPMRSAPVDVTLDGANVDSVALRMGSAETVEGSVEVLKGNAKAPPALKAGVRLDANDHVQTSETNPDGSFRIEHVFPDRYRVSVQPLPEDTWLKSVQLNGREISGTAVDLSEGAAGARLKITISPGAGRIEGRVVGEDGGPAASPQRHIVILSQGRRSEADPREMKFVPSGEKFQFTGLAPGKYRLLAIAAGDGGVPAENLSPALSKAAEIEIHEGDRLTRDIQATPLENSDAAR